MKIRSLILASAFAAAIHVLAQTDETESAPLPPTMGWSSWNTYGANISEQIIKRQADAMIDKGFAAAGYNFINIDDGYFANRDASGRLIIHPTRFPNGMRPVVDYIHSLGLKAGCYSDAGHNTCASKWGGETGGVGAGLYEHDEEDCEMYFNEFGFDFIKVDFCGGVFFHNDENLNLDARERYTAIRRAIDATGRKDIVFNACRWDYPGTWISDVADSWRVTGDINACWGSVKDIIHQSLYLAPYCSPGHYNDMDMLEVGRGLTRDEDVTHFGMWCIMSSPLLIGCDMASVQTTPLKLMTNTELIALNQDPLGLQAYVARRDGDAYILVKDYGTLHGTVRAVALYNSGDESKDITLDFEDDVNLGGEVKIRDLVKHSDLGTFTGEFSCTLRAHASRFLLLEAEERTTRLLYEAETAYLPCYQELENNSVAETAIYSENSIFSGGAGVGWLGKKADNCLQWRDVWVPEDAEYEMTVYYVSGETRRVLVSVNGERCHTESCNSGGWGTVKSFKTNIELKAGSNCVMLSNPSGWMPDIDYMELRFVKAGISGVASEPAPADKRAIDLGGRVVSTDGSLDGLPSGIYIQGGRKIMRPRANE